MESYKLFSGPLCVYVSAHTKYVRVRYNKKQGILLWKNDLDWQDGVNHFTSDLGIGDPGSQEASDTAWGGLLYTSDADEE